MTGIDLLIARDMLTPELYKIYWDGLFRVSFIVAIIVFLTILAIYRFTK